MSKFKIGNTVRFIDADNSGAHGTRKNALYVVDSAQHDMIGIGFGRMSEVFESRLALVSEGALPYTTGDKVTITNPGQRYDGYRVAAEAMGLTKWVSCYQDGFHGAIPQCGDVGTVLSAFDAGGYVLYAVEMAGGEQHILNGSGIAAYVAPVVPTFKRGDRVRVKASVSTPRHGWGRVKAGDVGVVHYMATSADTISVNFPAQSGWSGVQAEMELYTATPLEEAQEEIERLKKVLAKKDAELVEVRTLIGQATEILGEI